jgi:hypothetical protein
VATQKINTIIRKQTPPKQITTQTIWTNIEILQRFQSKTLRSILNAPWYINNHRIYEDLQMNTVFSEIKKRSTKCLSKLENHTNALAVNLLDNSEIIHRLKIHRPNSTTET